jgi:hypothetical protein
MTLHQAVTDALNYVSAQDVEVPPDVWALIVQQRVYAGKHDGPGNHDSGTPQQAHAGDGGVRNYRRIKDFKEAEDWAKQHEDKVFPHMTDKQKKLLDKYKRNSYYYRPLNSYLRKGYYDKEQSAWDGTNEMTAATKEIDAAIKVSEIPEDVTVFRGLPAEVLPAAAVGTEFIDKGYGSTSLDPKMAEKFARWTREDGYTPAIVEIKVPKGYDGVYMEKLWDNGESEILLPRNTKYRITSETLVSLQDVDGEVRYLTVEIVK